jgi:hypothetical protein
MRLGGLYFWERTNMPGRRIFAWHDPRSITWRWCLGVSLCRERPFGFWPDRQDNGLQWVARLPGLRVDFNQQPSMWRKLSS